MNGEGEALVRRFVEEVLNRGDVALLSQLVAEHHVGHDPLGDHYGPGGVAVGVTELRSAFPDVRVAIDELFAADDRIVHRFTLAGTQHGPFMGLAATGRPVRVTGIAIDRFAGGQLVERWTILDALSLLCQLGQK